MVNIDDFIKRLEIILEYYNLSASAFADKIKVQRSSLSHLLSGRNKPSLDFIIKVIEVFPEVDLYWILNGRGKFPKLDIKQESTPTLLNLENQNIENTDLQTDLFSTVKNTNLHIQSKSENAKNLQKDNNDSEEIDRIIIFFKNGTFKNYKI